MNEYLDQNKLISSVVLIVFLLVREPEAVDVCAARSFILEKANQYCQPFQEVAARYNVLIEKRLGVHISGPEGTVRVTTNDLGKNVFTITLFCPTGEALDIEQKLTGDFMSWWYQAQMAAGAPA